MSALATRAAALFLALLLAIGCDPGGVTDPPEDPPSLRGQVFDAMELPVTGARINLIYELEGYPPAPRTAAWGPGPAEVDTLYQNYPNPFNPATRIVFTLASAQPVHLMVLDSAGDTLRTLLQQHLPGGRHMVEWDGRDDAKNLLPNGVYRVQLTFHADVDGPSQEIGGVLSLSWDPAILAESALATTDAEGRFAIPFESMPIGEMIPTTSEDGVLMGIFPVSSIVQVHGAVDGSNWDRHSLDVGDGESDIEIELHLP